MEPMQSMISTKTYYWADVSDEYPESVMMFMYADKQKQTHNWLVYIVNVSKNSKMQNMLASLLLLFFRKQIFVLENEDIACLGAMMVVLMW